MLCGTVLLIYQETCAVIEVGEGIDLLQQLAVLVPLAAHFAATPDVGDGIDKSSVKKANDA